MNRGPERVAEYLLERLRVSHLIAECRLEPAPSLPIFASHHPGVAEGSRQSEQKIIAAALLEPRQRRSHVPPLLREQAQSFYLRRAFELPSRGLFGED